MPCPGRRCGKMPVVVDRARVGAALSALLATVALAACGSGGKSSSTTTSSRTAGGTTAATTGSSAAAAPAKRPAKTVKLTVEVNGDLLVHTLVWERARQDGHGNYDFSPMLREIRPYVKRADLAICHVETPMTPRPPQGYPVFNTPTQLARAIRQTGWRICDTASNHSLDQGQYGIDQTGLALDHAGILHTGSFRSPSAQRRTVMVRVKGVKVAFLAYTEMTNGIPLPHPWSVNLAHVGAVERAARAARRQGAQVVIVNFHWGEENVSQPSPFQQSTARALVRDPDITAIVGQHVHVVQPIERVGGKLVVFGEGQLLSNQSAACCPIQSEDGMMVFLHITVRGKRASVTNIDYVPTWNRHPDYTVLPIGDALRRHEESASVLHASYDRTTRTVGRIAHLVAPEPAHLP
jgi:poly-gamma-glutamate capsule biosynthesis protein CapA/YwtB (metallophosphatase superfamily)